MSRSIVLPLLALLMLAGSAQAEQRGFGAGVIIGETAGLSAKKWLGGGGAVDGALSWSGGGDQTVQVHIDYLRHNYKLLRELAPKGAWTRLSLYYGIGGRAKVDDISSDNIFSDQTDLGIRFPVGINFLFKDAPLGIFAELVPTLDLRPETAFRWRSAFGVRYYFR